MRWQELFSPRRLSTRIVGISLLLLLVVQGAGFSAIQISIDGNVRRSVAQELETGERIWRRLLQQKAEALVQAARVLAADYGFRSALGPDGDVETLSSALENVGDRIGAGVSAFVDTKMQLRALHSPDADLGSPEELGAIAAGLANSMQDRQVAMLNGRPVQFVAVPVRAPALLGWVVMGFPVDQSIVDDMRVLAGLEVAIVSGESLETQRLIAASPAASAPGLLALKSTSVLIGDEEWLVRSIPLGGGALAVGPQRSANAGSARVLLLRSVDEAQQGYQRLRLVLGAITLFGVVVFALGSMIVARRVTTPLRQLARASARLGRGEYDIELPDTRRRDEIGDLAQAFDRMRVSLASNQAEIHQLAYTDRLTRLPNRAQFREAVGAAIARVQAGTAGEAAARPDDERGQAAAGRGCIAVVMLDIDRFKHVNDVLGYKLGDDLLKAVAGRLKLQAREGDLVARFSGDEFALLLPGSNAAQALAVAERIAVAFEEPLTLQDESIDHTVDLGAGFGVACWPEHAADADALMSRAEIAMYTAKRKTASAMVYHPSIDAGSAQTLSLLSELRQAVERGELRLFLQPKIELATNRLLGAEALVRWQHPQRGLVPPMQFIPFAEQTGYVRQLTLWMFEEAARQWPVLRALGLERVSVNLSTRDLLDNDLLAKLETRLRRHGAPARAFCLEITESAIMDVPQRAEAMLKALSAAGFKLSIDDFGTGYSSLAYLKKLPVDELKIDKSFVIAMERDAEDAKIVRSTIDLAHNLGLSVVAEGVETANIMDQLRDLDCDEAQGYFMSRPLPAADLPGFAARWAARHALAEAD